MKRQVIESKAYEGLDDATHIDAEVYYTKGGLNFSGGTNRRGYYISVKPVTHKDGSISYVLFSGVSQLLLETDRFSVKQFKKAVDMGKMIAPDLVKQVLDKHSRKAVKRDAS